jgi:hypothetical protein
MLDLLSDYLTTNTSVEEKNHIAIADRVLNTAQVDYEHVIEEILAITDDADAGVTMQRILAVYRDQLFYLLTLHGVEVEPSVNLKFLAQIVDGLLQLDNYDNPQKLFDSVEEESPAIEKFCVLMSHVTPYNADQLMASVEEVSDLFINRLKEVNQVEEHEDENELNDRRERLHAFRLYEIYLLSTGATMAFLPNLLRSGVNPAMPYSVYADLIDSQSPLDALPTKAIARDLFGAALISCDGFSNPGETVKASLERYVTDPRKVAMTMADVRTLTMGYA